jgi:hypothetical protein
MSVPPWAGFVAHVPDDQVETRDDIAVYGGRNMAVALGEIFGSLGCTNVSEPWSAGEVGWEFDFDYRGRHSFWCRVQSFHPIFWLLLEGPSAQSERRSYPGTHFELWQKFASALEQDPRFDQIFWRTRDQGPPDWEEFSVTDDLPGRALLVELPLLPDQPRPKAAGGPLAPVVIGAWCALAVVVLALVENIAPGAEELPAFAIVALLVGLVIVLRMIDWRRKRRLQNSDEDVDSDL